MEPDSIWQHSGLKCSSDSLPDSRGSEITSVNKYVYHLVFIFASRHHQHHHIDLEVFNKQGLPSRKTAPVPIGGRRVDEPCTILLLEPVAGECYPTWSPSWLWNSCLTRSFLLIPNKRLDGSLPNNSQYMACSKSWTIWLLCAGIFTIECYRLAFPLDLPGLWGFAQMWFGTEGITGRCLLLRRLHNEKWRLLFKTIPNGPNDEGKPCFPWVDHLRSDIVWKIWFPEAGQKTAEAESTEKERNTSHSMWGLENLQLDGHQFLSFVWTNE